MKIAIFSGILGIPPTSVSAAVSCPSGECTWQAYDTLAVQSLCENVTSKGPAVASYQTYQEDLYDPSVYIFASYNQSTRFFTARIGKRDWFRGTDGEVQASQTYECSLIWGVQSFSSATMTGGILVETKSPNLTYIEEDRVSIVGNPIRSSTQSPAGDYLSSTASNQSNFTVDESSSLNLFYKVDQLVKYIFAAIVERNGNSSFFTDPTHVFKNISEAISAQLRTVPFPSTSPSSSSSFSSSYSSISVPNTTTRTFVAPGKAFSQEPALNVRWVWLAFPVFLLFSTTAFLFLVIFTARNPVWKDSIWPLLGLLARPRHQGAMRIGEGEGEGQAQRQGQEQGWGNGVGDMKRMMAGVRVRLQRGGRGVWGFTLGKQEAG